MYTAFSVVRWLIIGFSGLVWALALMAFVTSGMPLDIGVAIWFIIFVVTLMFQIRADKKHRAKYES